jgi:hypothetical protein
MIPPPCRSYTADVRAQADKLEEFAQRILARVEELRESADRQEGRR